MIKILIALLFVVAVIVVLTGYLSFKLIKAVVSGFISLFRHQKNGG